MAGSPYLLYMSEAAIRLSVFLGLLVLFAIAEELFPRRARLFSRGRRWSTNLLISVLNTFVLRLLGPVTAVGVAIWAGKNGWGVLNISELPVWLSFILGFLLLDFAIYLQHWATHKIPLLWRLHKVHHADRDIDVTTAVRFHPIEIALSMIYKCAWVLLIGPAAITVMVFEIILNGTALFNHANLKLPVKLDRWMRLFIVTPDMHRVHHSVRPSETHSNFGFSLSLWDRLFRTYTAQPQQGHLDMQIGLPQYQTSLPEHLAWSLTLPFHSERIETGPDKP